MALANLLSIAQLANALASLLILADRVKDMIVTGDENVYSIEVERA